MFENSSRRSPATINADRPHDIPGAELHVGADRLIDELFSDLDLDLGGSVSNAEGGSYPHAVVGASLESALVPRSHQAENDDLVVAYSPLNSGLSWAEDGALVSVKSGQSSFLGSPQRLLIALGYVSLVGLTMFWVGRQLRAQQTVATPTAIASAPLPAVALVDVKPADIEFAQYLSKSIKQLKTAKSAPVTPVPTTSGSAVGQPTTSPGLPAPATQNPLGVNNPGSTRPQGTPLQPVAQKGITPQFKAKPGAQTRTSGIIAAAKAKPRSAQVAVAKPVPLSSVKNSERKFLGGMNLGAQPVFMVSVNGTTRQFKLNEAIDETGATFIEFDGEQSILKQGAQLRSVTAGQQF